MVLLTIGIETSTLGGSLSGAGPTGAGTGPWEEGSRNKAIFPMLSCPESIHCFLWAELMWKPAGPGILRDPVPQKHSIEMRKGHRL